MSAPTANASVQPLRLLNGASAKRDFKWQVKITDGELSEFTYEGGTKKIYTYWYTLVGDDPAWYVRGNFKSSSEAAVKEVANKFQDGLMFHMSKVAFDSKQKSIYVSAPLKFVLHMGLRTAKTISEGWVLGFLETICTWRKPSPKVGFGVV